MNPFEDFLLDNDEKKEEILVVLVVVARDFMESANFLVIETFLG